MERTGLLLVHFVCAVWLLGGALSARLACASVAGARDVASLRGALDVLRRGAHLNPALALGLLASGVLLGRHGLWQMAWFWAALLAWVVNLALAVGVVVPAARRLGGAAAQAGDGPIPEALDLLRSRTGPVIAQDLMIGLDLGILIVMVARPGAGAAFVWPLLGAALALLARAGRLAPRADATSRTGLPWARS